MPIDPKSLKLFIEVIKEGTITAVAQQEHIAAAAISRRIADLEASLGVSLVERSNKGLTPTAAGRALINRSHRVLNELDSIALQMHDYRSGASGYIRIYANMSAINEFLPQALKAYLTDNPSVQIDLTESLSTEIAKAVADNKGDIGILIADEPLAGVEYLPYHNDDLVIIVAQSHPLAERQAVTFAETLDYTYVGLPQGSQLTLQLTRSALALGRSWQRRFMVSSYGALCLMVEADLGIGIAPRRIAQAQAKALGIVLIDLQEKWAQRRLSICIRSYDALSPSARTLVDGMVSMRDPE